MKKIKIIALMGPAGSGKDYLLHEAIETDKTKPSRSLHEIISCTTRPPREGEKDGVNYHFITKEEVENNKDKFLELTEFRDWYYGTRYEDLDEEKINVGVFNPAGVRKLLKNENLNVKVFWVKASDKIRLQRQLAREENPNIEEIIRRYQTDKEDFSNIDFLYETIDNG